MKLDQRIWVAALFVVITSSTAQSGAAFSLAEEQFTAEGCGVVRAEKGSDFHARLASDARKTSMIPAEPGAKGRTPPASISR